MTSSPSLQRKALTSGPWHSRGYLPHFDIPQLLQHVTFRLADSLPAQVLDQLDKSCPEEEAQRRQRLDDYLDAGHGACVLQRAECAQIVQNVLLHRDRVDYRLLAWVVMPNHVHALIEPIHELASIVQAWKSVSSHHLKRFLRQSGHHPPTAIWQREYWDRYIRDENHYFQTLAYIADNPRKAGLKNWPFQSESPHSPTNPKS